MKATKGPHLHWLGSGTSAFRPHEDWSQGGPIIEREKILLWPVSQSNYGNLIEQWTARCNATPERQVYADTPLVAAMRAYVASKYGDEVPDIT